MIQSTETKQQATAQHKKLDVFAGKWKTTGVVKTGTSEEQETISGTDVYEWMEGGYFLLHKVEVNMGGDERRVIEIIGFDPIVQNYTMHSFDSQGNSEEMKAVVDNDIWTITGNDKRCTVVFNEKGNVMIGKWEKLVEGIYWAGWMNMELTKEEE